MNQTPNTARPDCRLLRLDGALREVATDRIEDAVLVCSGPIAGTAAHMSESWPGFQPFTDHELYRTGSYRCEIRPDDCAPYSANRRAALRFHSDMALTREPPQISSIRCIVPDEGPPGSGDNLFIHIADIEKRLNELGRLDILHMLRTPRSIRLADGTVVIAPMLATQLGSRPLRVFDRIGWQMPHDERTLLEEALCLLDEWRDLHVRIRLNAGDAVIFSNWHFLHSRAACTSTTRVTEISLGFIRQR